jgi:hypothetical protein
MNSGFHANKAGAVPLKPNLQSICSGYFEDGVHVNYLPELTSNHNPPDLNLQSS